MILVDSNILIDLFTDDPLWRPWSEAKLIQYSEEGLAINPIIYTEISLCFRSEVELEKTLDNLDVVRLSLPFSAGFIAAQAFRKYKKNKGEKRSPLPDFFIGAHAAVDKLTLLTRDRGRYKTYFSKIKLISPN